MIDEQEGDMSDSIMRARWMMDGATSIEEMAEKLEQKADLLREIDDEGGELEQEVQNDYAFIVTGSE